MKRWICKQCGLYQKVNLNGIQVGRKVYFYRSKDISNQSFDQINNKDVVRGVVINRNRDYFTILCSGRVFRVKAKDIFQDDATANFLYNMFGTCEC